MGSEGRPPEDLQEAVAATLRRLRGEARNQGPARGPRIEPQLSPAPGPAAAPAAPAPFTAAPAAPPPAASSPAAWSPPASPPPASPPPASSSSASRAQASAASAARPAAPEPDLLSAFATEIPPSPKARESVRAALAADVEADEGKRPGRHWLRYVAGLIMVAALAGAGWWAYRNFAGGSRSGEVPVVTAEQTPEKVPPTDQLANQAPAQDKTVYNGISSSSTPQQNGEVLLPQPESPAPPPAPAPAPTAADAAPASGAASSTPPATTGGESAPPVPAPAPSLPTANSTTGSTAETLLPAPGAAPSTPPASTSTSSSSPADATSAAAAPPPAPPAPPEAAPSAPATGATGTVTTASATPAASAPPVAKEPTAPGNYRVQLASLKTEADANRTWKRLSTKYKDILGPLSVHLEKADLGTKGTYFRVQAGPFTDKAAAKDVCVKLKVKGQPCLVKP